MPTTIHNEFVAPIAGIDSTTDPLPLQPLYNGQYSDYSFRGITIPNFYETISSIKIFYKRQSTGNAYLRFRISHTDVDNPPASQTSDVDSLTAYAGSGTDGKYDSFTIPAAAYNALTFDSGDILGIKVERDAADALDTYESDLQIAFVQIVFNESSAAVAANDIVLLADIKDYLRKTDTNQDNFLQDWLTIISGQIEEYCDRKFREQTITGEIHDGDGTEILYTHYFPITQLDGATDAAKLANLQYRNDPDSAWTDIETDIDHVFLDSRNPYIEFYDEVFPLGRRNIKVSYKAGYTSIPADVQRVCIEMVAILWKECNAGGFFRIGEGSVTNSIQGTNFTIQFIDLDKRWKALLDRYRKVVI